jgi:hypothetical protein
MPQQLLLNQYDPSHAVKSARPCDSGPGQGITNSADGSSNGAVCATPVSPLQSSSPSSPAVPPCKRGRSSPDPDSNSATFPEGEKDDVPCSDPLPVVLPSTSTEVLFGESSNANAASVELWLPTSFTTACGRTICIREKRLLPAEHLAVLKECMLLGPLGDAVCRPWRQPRPLLRPRRSESQERPPRGLLEDIFPSSSLPHEAPGQAALTQQLSAPYSGFCTAAGSMIFLRRSQSSG